MESNRRPRGPATTESLYQQYLGRFEGDHISAQQRATMLTRDQFYDPTITPWEMRRDLAATADTTFRGNLGRSHCIKKGTFDRRT
jgi:hypothetical protein